MDGITEIANAPAIGVILVILLILAFMMRELVKLNQQTSAGHQRNVEADDVRSDRTIQDWREAYGKLEGKMEQLTTLYNLSVQSAATAVAKFETVVSELGAVRKQLETVTREIGKELEVVMTELEVVGKQLQVVTEELRKKDERLGKLEDEILKKDERLAKIEKGFERSIGYVTQLKDALNEAKVFVPAYAFLDDEGVLKQETPEQAASANKVEAEVITDKPVEVGGGVPTATEAPVAASTPAQEIAAPEAKGVAAPPDESSGTA